MKKNAARRIMKAPIRTAEYASIFMEGLRRKGNKNKVVGSAKEFRGLDSRLASVGQEHGNRRKRTAGCVFKDEDSGEDPAVHDN